MGRLTDVTVRSLKLPPNSTRPARFGDGEGLYLQIALGDTKSWLFRYTHTGKAREMGLGAFGKSLDGTSLAKARILAGEARAKLRVGIDPIEERQARRRVQTQPSLTPTPCGCKLENPTWLVE